MKNMSFNLTDKHIVTWSECNDDIHGSMVAVDEDITEEFEQILYSEFNLTSSQVQLEIYNCTAQDTKHIRLQIDGRTVTVKVCNALVEDVMHRNNIDVILEMILCTAREMLNE